MALVQLAAPFDAIKGKVGAYVFQTSPYGQVLKMNSKFLSRPSPFKTRQQINLAQASARWRALSSGQRDSWNAAAPDFPIVNKYGDPVIASGFTIFCQTLLLNGPTRFSLISSAPALITDGSDWSITWSATPGQIRFTRTENAGASTVSILYYLTRGFPGTIYSARKRYRLIARRDNVTASGADTITSEYLNVFPAPSSGQRFFWIAEVYGNLSPQLVGGGAGSVLVP